MVFSRSSGLWAALLVETLSSFASPPISALSMKHAGPTGIAARRATDHTIISGRSFSRWRSLRGGADADADDPDEDRLRAEMLSQDTLVVPDHCKVVEAVRRACGELVRYQNLPSPHEPTYSEPQVDNYGDFITEDEHEWIPGSGQRVRVRAGEYSWGTFSERRQRFRYPQVIVLKGHLHLSGEDGTCLTGQWHMLDGSSGHIESMMLQTMQHVPGRGGGLCIHIDAPSSASWTFKHCQLRCYAGPLTTVRHPTRPCCQMPCRLPEERPSCSPLTVLVHARALCSRSHAITPGERTLAPVPIRRSPRRSSPSRGRGRACGSRSACSRASQGTRSARSGTESSPGSRRRCRSWTATSRSSRHGARHPAPPPSRASLAPAQGGRGARGADWGARGGRWASTRRSQRRWSCRTATSDITVTRCDQPFPARTIRNPCSGLTVDWKCPLGPGAAVLALALKHTLLCATAAVPAR